MDDEDDEGVVGKKRSSKKRPVIFDEEDEEAVSVGDDAESNDKVANSPNSRTARRKNTSINNKRQVEGTTEDNSCTRSESDGDLNAERPSKRKISLASSDGDDINAGLKVTRRASKNDKRQIKQAVNSICSDSESETEVQVSSWKKRTPKSKRKVLSDDDDDNEAMCLRSKTVNKNALTSEKTVNEKQDTTSSDISDPDDDFKVSDAIKDVESSSLSEDYSKASKTRNNSQRKNYRTNKRQYKKTPKAICSDSENETNVIGSACVAVRRGKLDGNEDSPKSKFGARKKAAQKILKKSKQERKKCNEASSSENSESEPDVKKRKKKHKKRSEEKDNVSEYNEIEQEISAKTNMATPNNIALSYSEQKTRSSTRLRKKLEMKGSMKLPERSKCLDQIESYTPEKDFSRKRKIEPRKLVNNFFKEKSTYNCDKFQTYHSDDSSGENDFIVDDEECVEYESEYSEDDKPIKSKSKKPRKRAKRRPNFSSSGSSNESSDDRYIKPCKSTKMQPFESESSTESSNVELNVSARHEKKQSLVLKSDSEGDSDKEMHNNAKMLPRRRNKERERSQKAAAVLKRKRELANSKLPLDRRRYLEKEIDEEISSELDSQFDEELDIVGINDIIKEDEKDDLVMRDSDKEFIASCSNTEDEEIQFKIEEEIKICLENLRNSRGLLSQTSLLADDETGTSGIKNRPDEKKIKFHRVILDYDSNEDIDDKNVADLFKIIHKRQCCSDVIKNLVLKHEGVLDSVDSHGRKPLHVASIVGNPEAVETLLELGANASALDRNNMLSIAYAAYWKNPKILQLLIKYTNLPTMCRLLQKHLKGMSLLHLIVLDVAMPQNEDVKSRQIECLNIVQKFNPKMYSSLLNKADKKQRTPILTAISEGNVECLKEFFSADQSLTGYRTDIEGTVLHLAVEFSDRCKDNNKSACLLLDRFQDLINEPDKNGFTPLMYAAETGNTDCMRALLDHSAAVDLQDNMGTSALHLAAAIGNTECVKLLLDHGHPVDVLDDCGWPPLLYANFQSCESCVVELMKVKPQQLFVLSSLLKDCDEKQKEKNMQVVRSTILSLANQDAYYQIFNDFIRQNLELLDEFNFGIFSSTWKAILDFDNKQRWFRRRVWKLRRYDNYRHLTVKREHVLECAMEFFEGQAELSLESLNVMFHNEPGVCTGPKKEFLICLCNEVMQPEAKLFTKIDDQQFSPTPLSFFADILWRGSNFAVSPTKGQSPMKDWSPVKNISLAKDSQSNGCLEIKRQGGSAEVTNKEMMSVKIELNQKLKAMRFIGRFVAACIADKMFINLHLSKPFIKQILGQSINHPDDLQSVDNGLYNGMVKWVLENSVDDMEMPFSINCTNPWIESRTEEVQLKMSESMLTDKNKGEFTMLVSKFKLCDSINKEVKAFKTGFYQELSQELISVFTPDEFSLLMNGVQSLDVNDWKKNTRYSGWNCDDREIIWFWKTVEGLKQEEKALLLRFSTGSPCVPPGGFKDLEGLGGSRPFTIAKGHENKDSIPTAATCFNILNLSFFSSEKELREKVLIAVRHGSEGFAFG